MRIRILPFNLMRMDPDPTTNFFQIWTLQCSNMNLYGFHFFTLMRILLFTWCGSWSGSSFPLWCGSGSSFPKWCGSGTATLDRKSVKLFWLPNTLVSVPAPIQWGSMRTRMRNNTSQHLYQNVDLSLILKKKNGSGSCVCWVVWRRPPSCGSSWLSHCDPCSLTVWLTVRTHRGLEVPWDCSCCTLALVVVL